MVRVRVRVEVRVRVNLMVRVRVTLLNPVCGSLFFYDSLKIKLNEQASSSSSLIRLSLSSIACFRNEAATCEGE